MQANEQQSILTIALLAAFADGHKADAERESIRQLADTLGDDTTDQRARKAGRAKT